MKQDVDLIRSILLLAEEQPAGHPLQDFSPLETDQQVVVEHVWLAEQKGLVDARFSGGTPSNGIAMILRLTPAGHDFLAQAGQPALWQKAKEAAAKVGVGVTVDTIVPILTRLTHLAIGNL